MKKPFYELTLRLTTPLLIGNYKGDTGVDLKLSSLRGVMKDFFRSMIAPFIPGDEGQFKNTLWELDHYIFGHTTKDYPPVFRGRMHTQNGVPHIFINCVSHREHEDYLEPRNTPRSISKKAMPPGTEYKLQFFPVTKEASKKMDVIVGLLLGVSMFSGVGQMRRRGYGSFEVTECSKSGGEESEGNTVDFLFEKYRAVFAAENEFLKKAVGFHDSLLDKTINIFESPCPLIKALRPAKRGDLFLFAKLSGGGHIKKTKPFFIRQPRNGAVPAWENLIQQLRLGIHNDSATRNEMYGFIGNNNIPKKLSRFWFSVHPCADEGVRGLLTFSSCIQPHSLARFDKHVYSRLV